MTVCAHCEYPFPDLNSLAQSTREKQRHILSFALGLFDI